MKLTLLLASALTMGLSAAAMADAPNASEETNETQVTKSTKDAPKLAWTLSAKIYQ